MSEIRVNHIQSKFLAKTSKKEEKSAPQEQAISSKPEFKKTSADDVFAFMEQTAVTKGVKAKKPVDPSKYVNDDSKARIAKIMEEFEDKILNATAEAVQMGLSEHHAQNVAITAFNRKFLV